MGSDENTLSGVINQSSASDAIAARIIPLCSRTHRSTSIQGLQVLIQTLVCKKRWSLKLERTASSLSAITLRGSEKTQDHFPRSPLI